MADLAEKWRNEGRKEKAEEISTKLIEKDYLRIEEIAEIVGMDVNSIERLRKDLYIKYILSTDDKDLRLMDRIYKEGYLKGYLGETKESIKEMISENYSNELISKITKLPIKIIEEIRNEYENNES